MKAIMVMYDSLRRDLLGCNGGPIPTPNFQRLKEHTVSFECSYVGSLPCMPARRELHTGRYNFLHRDWGPMEPYDDSMPELLKKNNVHTRLVTDHYHYFEDGGCTYHSRYSDWALYRGQETDTWVSDLTPRETGYAPCLIVNDKMTGTLAAMRRTGGWQNMANRKFVKEESDFPMHKTFDDGIDFLERNGHYDNWFLQIETFDPHEPFTEPEKDKAKYFSPDAPCSEVDWPSYAAVEESPEMIENLRKHYYALTEFCDRQLGRVLDKMDELDLWEDTMLIVNTDHGFFLSEHGWWGKGPMPNYEELVHTPLWIWDPRFGRKDEKCGMLVQTIDLAPTLLDYFGVEIPKDMLGKPLHSAILGESPIHEYVLFGYKGSAIGITDGRFVLLHAVADFGVQTCDYTLMPTRMRSMFSCEQLQGASLAKPFTFTKGVPVLKVPAEPNPRFAYSQKEGEDLLFDLKTDPKQEHPLTNEEKRQELLTAMAKLVYENDAPDEIYERYALEKPQRGADT